MLFGCRIIACGHDVAAQAFCISEGYNCWCYLQSSSDCKQPSTCSAAYVEERNGPHKRINQHYQSGELPCHLFMNSRTLSLKFAVMKRPWTEHGIFQNLLICQISWDSCDGCRNENPSSGHIGCRSPAKCRWASECTSQRTVLGGTTHNSSLTSPASQFSAGHEQLDVESKLSILQTPIPRRRMDKNPRHGKQWTQQFAPVPQTLEAQLRSSQWPGCDN